MPNKKPVAKKPATKKSAPKKVSKPKAPKKIPAAKKPSLTKDEKQKLAHTKMMMHEATQEIRVNKEMEDEIQKRGVAHPELLTLPIIGKGVTNKFAQADSKYLRAIKKLDKAKVNFKSYRSKENTIALEEAKNNVIKLKQVKKAEWQILQKEVKAINRLNKLSKGAVSGTNEEGDIITVKGVNKLYASKSFIFKALHGANVSIKRGSFNVILGPSGSGKTTLLNVLSGLDRATYGEIVISGTNISSLSTRQLTQFRRNNIGFIFQSYNLLASLNVSDNVEVGRTLQTDPNKRKDIKDLLESMDMGDHRKKRTYELSGGQQQRVSIARALSKTPNILIGDEPTGALDQVTSLKVFQLFQEINKTQKATVIIVTHNANVAMLADQVIHVKNGKIDKIVQNSNPKQAKDMKEI